MKTAVVYFSRSGKTKKIAQAIAEAAGITAQQAAPELECEADLVFVGGALYAGDIDKRLAAFLKTLTPKNAGLVAAFSTAAGDKPAYQRIKEQLEGSGVKVAEEYFHCPGKFLFANRGRPNEQDLKNAAEFAKKIMAEMDE